jgi:hypothetical protein
MIFAGSTDSPRVQMAATTDPRDRCIGGESL